MNTDTYKELLNRRDEIQKQIEYIESEFSTSRLFHIDAYVLLHDPYDIETIDEVISMIKEYVDDIDIVIAKSEKTELLWYDDIDLNHTNCPIENYQQYFE